MSEHAHALQVDKAFKEGDLAALRLLRGETPGFPNNEVPGDLGGGHCLEYAIYHSPISFVEVLVRLGADPNYADDSFPSVMAALSTQRMDKYQIVELLLRLGADVNQRGINDWTPLHFAAVNNDTKIVELLVANGADLAARTRVDDFATPLEEAEILGSVEAVEILKKHSE